MEPLLTTPVSPGLSGGSERWRMFLHAPFSPLPALLACCGLAATMVIGIGSPKAVGKRTRTKSQKGLAEMKREGWVTLAVFLLVTTAMAACAAAAEDTATAAKSGPAELLKLVPDDAFLVVGTRSISECEEGLKAFVSNIVPEGMGESLKGQVLKSFVNDTGDGGGLDSSGAMAMALLADENQEVSAIVFVPITDYDAWREAWGESVKKDEGETYEYVESYFGGRSYFVRKEGYIAFSEGAEELDAWSKALATPLSQGRRAQLEKAMNDAPLALEVSVATVHRLFPEAASELESSLAGMGMGATLAGPAAQWQSMVKIFAKAVEDVLAGIDEDTLRATPSAEGLVISGELSAIKGSVFGDIFSQQTSVDISDLSLLPAGAVMVGAGGLRGEAVWKYLTDLNVEVVKAAAATPEEAEAGEKAVRDNMELIRSTGLGENAVGGLVARTGSFGAIAAVYRAKDAAKALDALVKAASDPKANPVMSKAGLFGSVKAGDVKITEETIEGIPVKVITQTLDTSEAGPDGQQMIEKMFGSEIVSRLAAKDGRLYLTSMEDGQLMQELLKGGGGVDIEKVKKSIDAVGGDVSGVCLLSVPGFFVNVMGAKRGFGAGAPELEGVTVPTTSQYAGVGVSFGSNMARFTISVPMEEILAVKAIFSQVASQGFEEMEEEPAAPASTDSMLEDEGSGEDKSGSEDAAKGTVEKSTDEGKTSSGDE